VGIQLLAESYQDLLALDTRHFPFRPGMSASVEILTKYENQVLAVPINAVTTREEEEDAAADGAARKGKNKGICFCNWQR
jgi:HlyD family secretion protein